MKRSSIIILLGPPSSGKGTQAQLLADKTNFYHLETSKIIIANLEGITKDDFVLVEGEKYFLFKEKKMREKGVLMSPPLITYWIKEKVKELAKDKKGIIFSGSPRTLHEGEKVIPFLKKLYGEKNILVLIVEVSEKEIIHRATHRKTCSLMRHPILYTEETANLRRCPIDNSPLVVRKDDTPEAVRTRLKEYQDRTTPLVRYFRKQNLRIKKINGEKSVEEVFDNILRVTK